MKILVCIKQVMESGSEVKINDTGLWVQHSEATRFEINKYDEYAVEEAILIKEKYPETHIDVVTVGPSRAKDSLRRALGMGADEGIHIIDENEGYRPPAVTASWIAEFAAGKKYDLIFTGIMSDDEMNSQTGPMIAQLLDIPCASTVIKEALSEDKKRISIEREIEGGAKDQFETSLPCLLTIQTGINSPRYPSLSKVMRAKKKTFDQISSETLSPCGSQPALSGIGYPVKTAQGIFLEGDPKEKAEKLLEMLTAKSLL